MLEEEVRTACKDLAQYERILAIDLDMVLTGDISPIVQRAEPVVVLTTDQPNIPVNGSLVLVTPGAAEEVWSSFDPATSPTLARRSACHGSGVRTPSLR